MDETERRPGRQRVALGRYNQYLKRKDPISAAPASSKRILLSSVPIATATLVDGDNVQGDGSDDSRLGDAAIFTSAAAAASNVAPTGTRESSVTCDDSGDPDSVPGCDVTDDTTSFPGGGHTFGIVAVGAHSDLLRAEHDDIAEVDGDNAFFASTDLDYTDAVSISALTEVPAVHACNDYIDVNSSVASVSDPHGVVGDGRVPHEGDQPVFPGARLTLGESMLLVMSFLMKYSITGECLKDLLNLISLHCPPDNLLPCSISSFKKWFEDIKNPLKVHKYCAFCHMLLGEEDFVSGLCPNEVCNKVVSHESGISHFIELPIADQIVSFFQKPGFLKDIQNRFVRCKESESAIEDIYDGEVYRRLSGEGQILSSPHNLSLMWNTDGVQCFRSSNMTLWPLFFQINELPYAQRISPENMVLGGLWFGKSKPSIMSFTEPFVGSLQNLEKDGVFVTHPDGDFVSKVCVIGGSADLPARSLVLNTTQYNGKHGCCKCLQPGETCKVSANGHVHVFPFDGTDPDGPKRTHDGHVEDAGMAAEINKTCRGVKGPCFLMCLMYYNLVSGTCIDYMHGVLLGVTKLLLSLWFMPEHSKKPFSLSSKLSTMDARMKALRPPNVIKRLPRSIQEHLKHFKASELRSWLLYYSLPLLRDLQGEEYFQHYLLLVNAVFLLLQESVSEDDVGKADRLLQHFCCTFAALYGDRYMTCNVHQLLHLPDMVRDMGPLWVYSCFSFENANGRLLKMFNGTQKVDWQIIDGVNLLQNLPRFHDRFFRQDSEAADCLRIMEGHNIKEDRRLEDGVFLVGGFQKRNLSVDESLAVSEYMGHVPTQYLCFNRVRIGKFTFFSKKYSREKLRNSRTIAYLDKRGTEQCGQIAFYMQMYPFCSVHGVVSKLCDCVLVENVALIHPHEKVQGADSVFARDTISGADVDFISALQPCDLSRLSVVPIQNILRMCVLVEPKGQPIVYACSMPNSCEHD